MAVTTILTATGSGFNTTISTSSFTVSSGEGIVLFALTNASSNTFSSATWNGESMGTAKYTDIPSAQSNKKCAVYSMSSPTPGTGVCTVNLSGSNSTVLVYAVVVSGHNTTNMLRDLGSSVFVSASGGTLTSPFSLSNNIASATGDLVIDAVMGYYGSTGTPGAGQTELVDTTVVNLYSIQSSKEAGASTVTMSWTLLSDAFYTHLLISIQPADAGSTPDYPRGRRRIIIKRQADTSFIRFDDFEEDPFFDAEWEHLVKGTI